MHPHAVPGSLVNRCLDRWFRSRRLDVLIGGEARDLESADRRAVPWEAVLGEPYEPPLTLNDPACRSSATPITRDDRALGMLMPRSQQMLRTIESQNVVLQRA